MLQLLTVHISVSSVFWHTYRAQAVSIDVPHNTTMRTLHLFILLHRHRI